MSDEFARTQDVLDVLGGERVSYPNVIAALESQGLPTRGVGMVVKGPVGPKGYPSTAPSLAEMQAEVC